MKPKLFDIEKIQELLVQDKIELALKVILENLKYLEIQTNKIKEYGESAKDEVLSYRLKSSDIYEWLDIVNQLIGTSILLSATINRLELGFNRSIVSWDERSISRNKVIIGVNSLLTDLSIINIKYNQLFGDELDNISSRIFSSAGGLPKETVYFINLMEYLIDKTNILLVETLE